MKTLRLSNFGVTIILKHKWLNFYVGGSPKAVLIPADHEVCTTQKSVDISLVKEKIKRIENGEVLRSDIYQSGGKIWLWDGHHIFVAYKMLNKTPRAWSWASGPDKIAPPAFRGARRNPNVSVSGNLYHGTAIENVAGILKNGLKPSGGSSVHRTKTRKAIFLTDSLLGGFWYSTAGSTKPAIVFEIDAAGMDIQPDYDDAANVIDADLKYLEEESGKKYKIGCKLTQKDVKVVSELIDRMRDDERVVSS